MREERLGFEQVVLPHLDAAYSLARWLLRDPALAQDVVQDAMVRALDYFASYRGGNSRAWVLQIVRNAAFATLAKNRTGGETPLDDTIPDPGVDPETAYAQRQSIGNLEADLAALPIEIRECLVLREFQDMSYRSIAEVTGVPIGTVMSRLWRGRQALLQARASKDQPKDRPKDDL